MIHIIEYVNTDAAHMDHWRTVVPLALEGAGYDVNVISGTDPLIARAMWNLSGEIFYKTKQFESVYREIASNNIKRGDIIIFGDAWNPTLISLKYINLISNLGLIFVGIWRDGIYDVNSKIRTGMLTKPKRWAKTFERALFDSYDYSCFITQEQKDRFFRRYHYKDHTGRVVTGLPYENLIDVRNQYTPVEKENIIVLPHDAADPEQRDIFKALRRYLKDYIFVDCYEMNLSSSEYYSILNRAKAILAINLSETDPTNIYEGMLFGCVPIIPDSLIYKEVFPATYQYPAKYTQPPFLNFVRGRDYMHAAVESAMTNYHDMVEGLQNDATRIGKAHFSNEKFLSIIKQIHE